MKALLLASLAISAATIHPAAAQAPAAQALGGAAVPGVCLLSREAIFANAKVGLAATARLQQLTKDAEAEVEADRKPILADIQTFQSQRANLKPAELQQREQTIGARQQAVQAKAQQRSQELELTRQKALAQIGVAAQPVIADAYKAKGCGLLVNRDSVLGGNMTNDLTPAVVQGLDARLTTITFDRATLPAPTQTASAAR